jgi:hypothetical protein
MLRVRAAHSSSVFFLIADMGTAVLAVPVIGVASSSPFFLIADMGMAVLAVSAIGAASPSPFLVLDGTRRLVISPGVAVAADIGSFRKNPR